MVLISEKFAKFADVYRPIFQVGTQIDLETLQPYTAIPCELRLKCYNFCLEDEMAM